MVRGTAEPQQTMMACAPQSMAHIWVSYRLETSTRSPGLTSSSMISGLVPMQILPLSMWVSALPTTSSASSVSSRFVQRVLADRFGLTIEFESGGILYKETISQPVEGVGHFEPLRHYAEVHLRLEPLPAGSGVQFGTATSTDELDLNWQRLALTNAMERDHLGVLTGSPITDVRITLTGGRAHAKHTEGGDFRQATYRAIRQGLMQAREAGAAVLLEPWYHFELEVPGECVGRALSDATRMGAEYEPPTMAGDRAKLVGRVPASEVQDYALEVAAYTSGRGHLYLEFAGYAACHDAERVIETAAYEPEADLPNTPDSVFCSHGAGYTVKWYDVPPRRT